MFRSRAQSLGWMPTAGMQVEVRALPTIYEARGKFQLTVDTMRRSGLGALYEAFARLKAKLDAEGLFDAARKRPLPRLPRQIGIVTSPQAAALRDVLATLRRRMPRMPVVIYPTPVQGEGAAQKIADAIRAAGEHAACDVLILARGGGSIEDLWAFNEEVVARAIRACPIPVISGIGHETDFTIADFAADVRAPTPTAAAELASPDRIELARRVAHAGLQLRRALQHAQQDRMQRLDYLSRRMVHPGERLLRQLARVRELAGRLRVCPSRRVNDDERALRELRRRLLAARPDVGLIGTQCRESARRLMLIAARRSEAMQATLQRLAASLHHLSPQHVLDRGYSIVRHGTGVVIRAAEQLAAGDAIDITFAHGGAGAKVTRIKDGD
jgi:exodeoxyribonuclease VII large subunit